MRVFSVYALFSERKYSLKTDICLMYFSFLPAIGKVCNVQPKNTAPFLRRQSLPLYVCKAPAMMPVFCMCNGKKRGRRTPATKNAADVCLSRKIRKISPSFNVLSFSNIPTSTGILQYAELRCKALFAKGGLPAMCTDRFKSQNFCFFSSFLSEGFRSEKIRLRNSCILAADFFLPLWQIASAVLCSAKVYPHACGHGIRKAKIFYSCPCKTAPSAASAASILRNSFLLTRMRQTACARMVTIQLMG